VQTGGIEVELTLSVPSDLGLVEEAVDLVARHCLTGALSPRRVRFNLRTALAEALGNAIVHGNEEDPSRVVQIRAELKPDEIRIHVTDEGSGFAPGDLPDPTATANRDSPAGRGLFLMAALVDQVAFNARGNSVCLTLRRE
jgi:serine/threonine-protein kinase RsbW